MSTGSQLAPTTIISGLPLTGPQRDRIAQHGGAVVLDNAAEQPDRALRVAETAEVWFGGGLDARILSAAPRLRWLQTASVGAEYNLFPELIHAPVTMTNVRRRHNSTCDHALGMMLAVARCFPQAWQQQRDRAWRRIVEADVLQLRGASVLILGTGQLGVGIASRAAAFGMVPDGYSRSGAPLPGFSRVYGPAELRTAVAVADWIVNALPFTPETKGLMSADVFAAVRPGAVFVNVGRGKTVDQAALKAALASGRLRAAALDVFVEEPLPADDDLWAMPNVMITPHAAGVMADGDPRSLGLDALVENLGRFRSGQDLFAPIDKSKGY